MQVSFQCDSHVLKACNGYCSFPDLLPPPLPVSSISLNAAEHMPLERSAGSRILDSGRMHFIAPSKKTNFITISWSGQHYTTIYSSDAPITILSHGGTKQGIIWILNQLFDASFHFYNKCFRTELTLFLEAMTLNSRHIPPNGVFKAMHCAQSCKNPQPLRTCCFAR